MPAFFAVVAVPAVFPEAVFAAVLPVDVPRVLVWLLVVADAVFFCAAVVEAAVVVLFFTVTVQTAFFPLPSFAFTVILAVPALIPFTFPVCVTVAIFLLDEVHVTFLFVALEGRTVAVSFFVLPFTTEMEL